MTRRKAKALGLISGGLDSMLSLKIVRDVLGCEVRAINFYTGFCITETQRRIGRKRDDGSVKPNEALVAGAILDTEVELIDISDQGYLDVIANPKYGYGANANPCIDCRINMFVRARRILEEWGGDFVFTGEVLGQRPKSQRRQTLGLIEKQSGLKGRLLRPLSAKLLPPTIAEQEGLIDCEKLFAISGRSRKEQMELARQFGLEGWPQPAGGCCYLTDEAFARKFFDVLDHREERRNRARGDRAAGDRSPLPPLAPHQADCRQDRGGELPARPRRGGPLPAGRAQCEGAGGPGGGGAHLGGDGDRLPHRRPLRTGAPPAAGGGGLAPGRRAGGGRPPGGALPGRRRLRLLPDSIWLSTAVRLRRSAAWPKVRPMSITGAEG